MAHATHAPDSGRYYIPHGSPWPFFGSVSLLTMLGGAAAWLAGAAFGPVAFTLGLLMMIVLFTGWFGTIIAENQAGVYNEQVDRSFRMGMMWFIFSEVMFFAAFFGALFYTRQLAVEWLGGGGAKGIANMLWPDYEAAWPTNGPARLGPNESGEFEIVPAFGLPALNTLILLSSGITVTIAHHALKAGKRGVLAIFLAATFLLGFLFVGLQATEYHHAWTELGLQFSTGVYGSTFFMLTGFHGLHVTIGAIMLSVIWVRCLRGHFTPERHFAFEAVAWYWHFVDVVWLGLFVFVYWL